MIATALKQEIESYVPTMRNENPLFVRASNGTLRKQHLVHYLGSVRFLIDHTMIHLARAAQRARDVGDERLASHFEHKAIEEIGHEQWARQDLHRLQGQGDGPLPVPAMIELVLSIEQTIDRDPVLHLAYMLFAEYFVTLLGPEWLSLLEERCGIPRESVSVIGKHAELDREHAQEAFELIDALVGDPHKLEAMRAVVSNTISLFGRFCAEAVAAGDRAIDVEHEAHAHAS